jgi:hypothetical protein
MSQLESLFSGQRRDNIWQMVSTLCQKILTDNKKISSLRINLSPNILCVNTKLPVRENIFYFVKMLDNMGLWSHDM